MNIELAEAVWLNEVDLCPATLLAEASGLTLEEIHDLIECGVLTAAVSGATPQTTLFRMDYIVTARTARRLRDDFQLDRHGVALALALLQRIEMLEGELDAVRAQQQRRISPAQPR